MAGAGGGGDFSSHATVLLLGNRENTCTMYPNFLGDYSQNPNISVVKSGHI